jgi:hypothetical protein
MGGDTYQETDGRCGKCESPWREKKEAEAGNPNEIVPVGLVAPGLGLETYRFGKEPPDSPSHPNKKDL